MLKPYVGVTGPVNVNETNFIRQAFSDAGYSMKGKHIPMIGFLVSYKSLNGIPMKNRRYPKVEDLPQMLEASGSDIYNMIHYNSREPNLADQVHRIFDRLYSEKLCRSLQLNIVWPDIQQVYLIKKRYPMMDIVFQASHQVIEGRSAKKIAQEISHYGDAIEYVLIDPSGGKGREFDIDKSVSLYSDIREICPQIIIGFAGGFTGENLRGRVNELIKKTGSNGFCIDAEGGLRDKLTDEYGDDLMNKDKVKKYIRSSSKIFK